MENKTTRFQTLASETVEWVSSAGGKIRFEVSLVREETDHGGDIGWRQAPRGLTVVQTVSIDGRREPGVGGLETVTGHDVMVAKIGRVGLKAETAARCRAAIATVEAHPAYVAELAAEAEGIKVMVEHEEHVAAVEAMMTLGGKTY